MCKCLIEDMVGERSRIEQVWRIDGEAGRLGVGRLQICAVAGQDDRKAGPSWAEASTRRHFENLERMAWLRE